MKTMTTDELLETLENCQYSYGDGKCRIVNDSSEIEADGEMWAVVNDHGNVEIGYKGRNGRLYWVGGLV
jgi:hypothetical protein